MEGIWLGEGCHRVGHTTQVYLFVTFFNIDIGNFQYKYA